MEVWDRKNSRTIKEPILSESIFRWLHESRLGIEVADRLISKRWFSRLYGWPRNLPSSANMISDFSDKYQLDLSEFTNSEWKTFNDFFIRKFKTGARKFSEDPLDYCSPCEGRLLVAEGNGPFPVKGVELNLTELVQSSSLVKEFEDCHILVYRLSPFDYHRFHFSDDGKILESYEIPGRLTSVHPMSLKVFPRTFLENQRKVSLQETQRFGRILSVEVGALCVGRIHSLSAPSEFKKGEENGYFLFGGSTLIQVIKKSALIIDRDISEKSQAGLECFVRLGERLGQVVESVG